MLGWVLYGNVYDMLCAVYSVKRLRKYHNHMTRNSIRRGNDFEPRAARLVDGTVYVGQDGDVDVTGTNFRLECKYVQGLRAFKTKGYHDQILDYEKRNPDKRFGLIYTGGRSYQNARCWVTIPLESFIEYIEFLRKKHAMELLGMSTNDVEHT